MKKIGTISPAELAKLGNSRYVGFIKAVVDIKNNYMVLDMDMHADGEQRLLSEGSNQDDLWGINLYPDKHGTDQFIEYDSMINIRPRQNNRSRNVEDPKIREAIIKLVGAKVK